MTKPSPQPLQRALGILAIVVALPFAAHASTKAGTPQEALGAVLHELRDVVVECDERAAPPDVVAKAHSRPTPKPAVRLSYEMTPEVRASVRHLTKGAGRATVAKVMERSAGERKRAEEIFREEGVPPELVWLGLVESGWQSSAVSPVGAAGVWQFMPETAKRFGLRVDESADERLDFEKSTRAAATYLRTLNRRYDGDWELAIGAYNSGEGNIDKAIKRAGGARDFSTLVARDLLPHETAEYVPKVLAASLVGSGRGGADRG